MRQLTGVRYHRAIHSIQREIQDYYLPLCRKITPRNISNLFIFRIVKRTLLLSMRIFREFSGLQICTLVPLRGFAAKWQKSSRHRSTKCSSFKLIAWTVEVLLLFLHQVFLLHRVAEDYFRSYVVVATGRHTPK